MGEWVVAADDPRRDDVRGLLERHLVFSHAHSPPEDVYALDVAGLTAANVSFFSIREGGTLLGVGALKQIDREHAEIKSMHTVVEARGRGVARAMLDYLVQLAGARGCTRVSLETGSMEAYAPARALYASFGFEPCPPFGEYRASPNSICMTRTVGPTREAAD